MNIFSPRPPPAPREISAPETPRNHGILTPWGKSAPHSFGKFGGECSGKYRAKRHVGFGIKLCYYRLWYL